MSWNRESPYLLVLTVDTLYLPPRFINQLSQFCERDVSRPSLGICLFVCCFRRTLFTGSVSDILYVKPTTLPSFLTTLSLMTFSVLSVPYCNAKCYANYSYFFRILQRMPFILFISLSAFTSSVLFCFAFFLIIAVCCHCEIFLHISLALHRPLNSPFLTNHPKI